MLKFSELDLSDRELIESFSKKYNCSINDYHFCLQYAWRDSYFPCFAILGDTLIIRGGREGKYYYQTPLGENDYDEAMKAVMKSEPEPKIFVPGQAMADKLELRFPGVFDFIPLENMDEYIYEREKINEYPGKKYQQKRNHINRFERRYGEITVINACSKNVSQIREFQQKWYSFNHDYHPDDIAAENKALNTCLDNFDAMKMQGVLVMARGELCGFALGELLSEDTAVEHFEKARRDMDGCYSVITRAFARSLPESVLYINREEDMGLDGLRQSKKSFHPCRMERKYSVRIKKD